MMFIGIPAILILLGSTFAQKDECDRTTHIAIIGAGPAGSYAAYLLRSSDVPVELVEATDRIGGRLYTGYFNGSEDVPLELGTMLFSEQHEIIRNLIGDLNLTERVVHEAWGLPKEPAYYIGGKTLKQMDIDSGENLPFELTPEEKMNANRLVRYYYEKLTNQTFEYVPSELRLQLVDRHGKKLYKQTIEEALNQVASPGGKKLLYAITKLKPSLYRDACALLIFGNEMDYGRQTMMMTINEGMKKLPVKLVEAFQAASAENKVSTGRELTAIEKLTNKKYKLQLKFTETAKPFGATVRTGPEEFLCADKVILAVTKGSLIKIDSPELKSAEISKAFDAVRMVPESKVFMRFKSNNKWMANNSTKATMKFTDQKIGKIQVLGRSNISQDMILMASHSEGDDVRWLENLNMGEKQSQVQDVYKNEQVTSALREEILSQLEKVFDTPFEKPQETRARFSTAYPTSAVWRANYHFDDAIQRIQRPSLTDDIFITSNDFSWGNSQSWTEGALKTVEDVILKYFFEYLSLYDYSD